jgi:LysR family transcriptional regulator, low CO2-responsive transcriptional regulator
MRYTLNQLQVFLTISKTLSVTKAAQVLNLTQPAVSIQLRNFQDQFQIPLTEIIGRKIFLTQFGWEVANAAENILKEVTLINDLSHIHLGQLTGILNIVSVSTGKYVIPFFLSEFLKYNPGVELKLNVTNKIHVMESLEKNTYDLSLVSVLPTTFHVENIELMTNKLYLIGNHEFKPSTGEYEKSLFTDLPLIYRETGSGTRQIMEKFIEQNRISPGKKLELTSNEAVKQAVIAGLGFSIMPLIGIKNELKNKELQIIPLKGLPISSAWNLVWMKGRKQSAVASAFIDFLKNKKSEIIAQKFSWTNKY